MTDLEAAARNVIRAIDVKGPRPDIHDAQVKRLREKWPTLWHAIEELRHAT